MTKAIKETISKDVTYQGIPGEIVLNTDKAIASWQRLQYGMFIHWGLYSELGGERDGKQVRIGYSEQIQMWDKITESDYLEVAKHFTAEQFDPKAICQLAKEAGMNYVVVTSKHHDGFAMFDTKTTDYNIVKQTPYGKDPLKLLSEECRRQGLKFGVYFSLVDWHQGHEFDENNNNHIPSSMEPIIEEQLRELMTNYGPIAEVWFDMSNPTTEQSNKFSKIVHQFQPEAAVNSRIWNNLGDFRTLADNQVPNHTLDCAWQTPASIYHETWGYRKWQERTDFSKKVRDLVVGLASVRARGGNYLLNIGPRGDGSIVAFEQDVLQSIGKWIDRHPKAIIGSSATKFGGQPWGEVTLNGDYLYLHITDKPKDRNLILDGLATDVREVVEDGSFNVLDWSFANNQLMVALPEQLSDDILPVIRVELARELRIIPPYTVDVDKDGIWTIKPENVYSGRSFADSGNYNTLTETIVRQTAYIANENADRVIMYIHGKAANHETNYGVALGNESRVVNGKELLGSKIGPFSVEKNKIIPLTITLAESNYEDEELNLTLETVTMKRD